MTDKQPWDEERICTALRLNIYPALAAIRDTAEVSSSFVLLLALRVIAEHPDAGILKPSAMCREVLDHQTQVDPDMEEPTGGESRDGC